MPNPTGHVEVRRAEMEAKLYDVSERLRAAMLARGFDPAQDENIAFTAPLAKLYAEREKLRAELEALNQA